MTDRSEQQEAPTFADMMLQAAELWQWPMAFASQWMGMMMGFTALIPPHLHQHFYHSDHDQLDIPPEIEVQSEQGLFA